MMIATRPRHVIKTAKGDARVASTDGQNVTLHADFAAPPGSPLQGSLHQTAHDVRVKVHGCRRIASTEPTDPGLAETTAVTPAPAQFEITGRWVNLSREARLFLLGETEIL